MKELNDKDFFVVDSLIGVVDKLIQFKDKYKISVSNLKSLDKALIALKEYPDEIISGYITIESGTKWLEGGSCHYTSTIESNYLEIIYGGTEYNEIVGSDHLSTIVHYTEFDEVSESASELDYWMEGFFSNIGEDGDGLAIIDDSSLN